MLAIVDVLFAHELLRLGGFERSVNDLDELRMLAQDFPLERVTVFCEVLRGIGSGDHRFGPGDCCDSDGLQPGVVGARFSPA